MISQQKLLRTGALHSLPEIDGCNSTQSRSKYGPGRILLKLKSHLNFYITLERLLVLFLSQLTFLVELLNASRLHSALLLNGHIVSTSVAVQSRFSCNRKRKYLFLNSIAYYTTLGQFIVTVVEFLRWQMKCNRFSHDGIYCCSLGPRLRPC